MLFQGSSTIPLTFNLCEDISRAWKIENHDDTSATLLLDGETKSLIMALPNRLFQALWIVSLALVWGQASSGSQLTAIESINSGFIYCSLEPTFSTSSFNAEYGMNLHISGNGGLSLLKVGLFISL